MASTATLETKISALTLSAFAAPFKALWRGVVILFETSSRMQALESLSRVPDAELDARGLNRDAEIRRIMGVAMLP
ncbi:hypothetical protein JJJ17_09100 [Paracoccus caeni]|uniref:DUF1127 domain-containing protein n=1 Tax=Paracoccus caeni TaxID=657651 RepID=A0A934SC27_9RHOB|nr:hypothetical protein [Paracoccus caeni]MBK4216081.1 hypothetical protein [Paracoccus caeni]